MDESPASIGQRAQYWDAAYESRGSAGVSWFQSISRTSVELISRLKIPTEAAIIDIGGGASQLVDGLVRLGFSDLSVIDISETALEEVRRRLGPDSHVRLLHEDLLSWNSERRYDLWHDRAVFHFLVDPEDRETYLRTLRSALRPNGTVIMATFAKDGPEYCSGLPVERYSSDELAGVLGGDFEVVEHFDENHVTPAEAIQPFTWIAARRIRTEGPTENVRGG
jgi:2-polyprenyl-3-methyl-5-hydroxy-6-metoxy-1,4-benzoquinol methylase